MNFEETKALQDNLEKTKALQNCIAFRSEERERNWKLESKMIVSEEGVVNERTFINKNISKILKDIIRYYY